MDGVRRVDHPAQALAQGARVEIEHVEGAVILGREPERPGLQIVSEMVEVAGVPGKLRPAGEAQGPRGAGRNRGAEEGREEKGTHGFHVGQSSLARSSRTVSGVRGMYTPSAATTSWPSRLSTSSRNCFTFGSSGFPGGRLT